MFHFDIKDQEALFSYLKMTAEDKLKEKPLEGYSENHHILPRSLGGWDSKDNLVEVTAAKHFKYHKLLKMIFGDNSGMAVAYSRMALNGDRELTAEEFEQARKSSALRGERNGNYNPKVRKVVWLDKGIFKWTRRDAIEATGYNQNGISQLFSFKFYYYKDLFVLADDFEGTVEQATLLFLKKKEQVKQFKGRKIKANRKTAKGKDHVRFDHQRYTWYRPINGKLELTLNELANTCQGTTNKISEVKNGVRKSYKGWILVETEEPLEEWYTKVTRNQEEHLPHNKVNMKNGKLNPRYDETVYIWYHDTLPPQTCTGWELSRKYSIPRQRLSAVVSGKDPSAYGWRLTKEPATNKGASHGRSIKQKYWFIHPKHGERYCLPSDISREFPKAKGISCVAKGRRKSSDGWRLR